MRFHTPELGLYSATRLAAGFTYGALRDRFSSKWIKQRQSRIKFDKKYHVDTADRVFVSELTPTDNEKRHSIRYEASDSDEIINAFNTVPFDPTNLTFIDIGAGKGKVLFIAASLSFKRIIGVEFDTALAAVIEKNILSYKNPDRQCDTIEVANANAREFQLPTGSMILFFYFPFKASLLSEVLENFSHRLDDCLLIWVTLESAEKTVIDSRPELTLLTHKDDVAIYRGRNFQLPRESTSRIKAAMI